MARLIKRYGSLKLYDTDESRYVSLEELGAWVREGQEVQVIDNETSEDVTSQTLTQVILEGGRRGQYVPPTDVLHDLIRRGGSLVSRGVAEVQEGVERLVRGTVDRLGPIREVRAETEKLRQRLEELERSLENLESSPDANSGS